MSSAKTYTATGSTPKTYNKNGEARANSAKKGVSGTLTASQLRTARRMGRVMNAVRGRQRGNGAGTPNRGR